MRFWFFTSILLASVFTASAQDGVLEQLQDCTTISDDAARLACYDALLIDTSTAEPEVVNEQGIPLSIAETIKANAEQEWPDDFSMQAFTIDQQTAAYLEVQALDTVNGIPEGTLITIKNRAEQDWGNDFSMQLFEINKQVDAYLEIEDMTEQDGVPSEILSGIKEAATSEWGEDFSMQLFTIEREVENYRRVNP